jgi:putative transposase
MASKGGRPRRGPYRRYTEKLRRAVLKDVHRLGRAEAGRQHGVPDSTVGNWLQKALAKQGANVGPRSKDNPQDLQTAKVSLSSKKEVRPAKARVKGKGVARHYTPSQREKILEHADREGVTAASKEFDVSRFSIYDWRRKVERAAAGEGPSPTGGQTPADLETQRDHEVLNEWHRQPGLGPSQVRNQLRRKGVKVSVHTVRRVMEEAGYRPPKVKRQGHDERFEAVRPNQLWHLDFVHRHINRADTFTLILLDDFSRYVTGHGVDDAERADLVVKTFEEAVQRHGRPEMVLHDKGAAFWSWRGISRFTSLLTELGIDQIAAEHKEWNGKLEVFNANLHKELFDVTRFYDVAEMRRRLAAHLHWYNHQRTSHALGGLLVPADRYYGRTEEVLARIEAGTGREGLEALKLRDRALELFKVVSKGGVPEVWLMGQKLFELPR